MVKPQNVTELRRLAGFVRWILGTDKKEALKGRGTDFHMYPTQIPSNKTQFLKKYFPSTQALESSLSDPTLKRKEPG